MSDDIPYADILEQELASADEQTKYAARKILFDIRKRPAERTVIGKKDWRTWIPFALAAAGQMVPLAVMAYYSFFYESKSLAPYVKVFVFSSLFFSLLLVNRLLYRLEMCVSDTEVSYRKRNLLGRTEWREPLSGYRGILLSRWKSSGRYVYYTVELYHDDLDRRIRLFDGFRWEHAALRIWKGTARATGLRALKKGEDGKIVEAAPEP